MVQLIKVAGDSMLPKYENDDYVFIINPIFKKHFLKIGDDIVFHSSAYGLMIKTICQKGVDGVLVKGSHLSSITTEKIGHVNYCNILGRVIFHIRKRDA